MLNMHLTPEQESSLVEAIGEAERHTSGEIKVHFELNVPKGDAVKRAQEVFATLRMHETAERNGILIYIATEDRRFAVWGDEGIHQKVGDAFWQNLAASLSAAFKSEQYLQGLRQAVVEVGKQLGTFFPRRDDDRNELSDGISYGG